MSFWNAFFFGLVQGVTEFLPLSSSAHLSVLFNLFGVTAAGYNAKMFSVFLHVGTLIAALLYYWKDFGEMFLQVFDFAAASQSQVASTRRNYSGVRLLIMMFFSCLPLAMILPLNGSINKLYNSTLLIGIMLILSGVVVYIAGQMKPGKKTLGNMSITDAIIVGLCQSVTAIPGLSRTGIVLTAGIAVGCKPDFSAKFAVMMSVPLMLVANIFRFVDAASMPFTFGDLPLCLFGMLIAAVSGYFSIRLLNNAVKSARYASFSYYSWVAGVIFIILTMIF